MAIPNCVSPQEMTAEQAANALVIMKRMIGNEAGIGVWEGSITSETTGNTFQGKHVSVFSENSLIAPFGQVGEQNAEAGAALFAIAMNNAEALAAELNTCFNLDVSHINDNDQVETIGMAAERSTNHLTDADATSKDLINSLLNKWSTKILEDQHSDVNGLFEDIEANIKNLKKFRQEIRQNLTAIATVDMVQVAISKVAEYGLNTSDLEPLVKAAFYFTAEKEGVDPLTDTAEHVNQSGINAQVKCLIEAYGVAGALHIIKVKQVEINTPKPKA